jgi:dolichol-phosphate mannosyltransferase
MTVALLLVLTAAQAALAVRVVARMLATAGGRRIRRCSTPASLRVSAIVPVLDERDRLGGCLAGLITQAPEVSEILVVDGGSTDGTQRLVDDYRRRDARVRLIDASPIPRHWTGKAWGLQCGLAASAATSDFVLCLDADVRPDAALARSLLAHAAATDVAALSVATRQRLSGAADGILHPALLATLVYRFGIPGSATTDAAAVQANGQCFLLRRELLLRSGALRAAQGSLCEDITIARCIAASGASVGFYESDDLIDAQMYSDWRDTWRNWPRSLPMRDQYFGWRGALGLVEVLLVQALALPALLTALLLAAAPPWLIATLAMLVALRVGVLAGMARAYASRPWTYWLSPCADVPVALALLRSALRRRHTWRGRTYVRAARGRFRLARWSSRPAPPPRSLQERSI